MKPFTDLNPELFNYPLPEYRIANFPAHDRDASKLLIRDKNGHLLEDTFTEIVRYLPPNSHLFFNNSRVIPARLVFTKPSGSTLEIFCLQPVNPSNYAASLSSTGFCIWECMVGNLKRFNTPNITSTIIFDRQELNLTAEKLERMGNKVLIKFIWDSPLFTFAEILNRFGQTPLPPYIKRNPVESDRERYQTIYSSSDGSVAAPTAGLHFTPGVFAGLNHKNIATHEVTLHVGAGTFLPVKALRIEDHEMHAEVFLITSVLLDKLLAIPSMVGSVGTTTLRTLESIYWLGIKTIREPDHAIHNLHLNQWEAYHMPQDYTRQQSLEAMKAWLEKNKLKEAWVATSLMIIPGYRFKMVNTLITNFHQPKSTLLMLIAAFIGDAWKDTYRYALDHDFRFLSYGDSSLLFGNDI